MGRFGRADLWHRDEQVEHLGGGEVAGAGGEGLFEVDCALTQIPFEFRPRASNLIGVAERGHPALGHVLQPERVERRLAEGELDAPKTRYGIRQVPWSPGLTRELWIRLATAGDDALVFATSTGGQVDRSKLYAAVRAAGKRAGIEWPVGLHTFRHSCASIMFRRGVPKEAIRRLFGHRSWDFTARTYLHLDDDDLPDGAVGGDLTATTAAREEAAIQASP